MEAAAQKPGPAVPASLVPGSAAAAALDWQQALDWAQGGLAIELRAWAAALPESETALRSLLQAALARYDEMDPARASQDPGPQRRRGALVRMLPGGDLAQRALTRETRR